MHRVFLEYTGSSRKLANHLQIIALETASNHGHSQFVCVMWTSCFARFWYRICFILRRFLSFQFCLFWLPANHHEIHSDVLSNRRYSSRAIPISSLIVFLLFLSSFFFLFPFSYFFSCFRSFWCIYPSLYYYHSTLHYFSFSRTHTHRHTHVFSFSFIH